MEKVSIIIPARKEPYLNKTIEDINSKAKGDIEIIVIKENPNMRNAINEGVAKSSGKYIMKLDAHCMLDEGFDLKLAGDHQENWVQIPRRKRLDAENWKLIESEDIDYMYLDSDLKGKINFGKSKDPVFKKILIDDTGSFQGSCWFMTKKYFNKLGLMDEVNFAGSGQEAQEICFNVWHDGGRVVRNKKTWYAHYHKTSVGFVVRKDKSRKFIRKLAKEKSICQ